MQNELANLLVKAEAYKKVLENTNEYRKQWPEVKSTITSTLKEIMKQLDIKSEIKTVDKIQNLESIVLDLGKSSSGIVENIENSGVHRTMVKNNGAIIYQQLFNGKIIVMIMGPSIEGYGEPKPPKTLEILRPDEMILPFLVKHVDFLLKEVIEWEDYDDNEPSKSKIGFQPIGFGTNDSEGQ
jgi:hypothetical protein